MFEWTTLYVQRRGEELRQDREKQLLIKQALEARGKRERFYRPVLARLGRQFTSWGESLQTRYTDIEVSANQRIVAR
jgi:hypothetical protein